MPSPVLSSKTFSGHSSLRGLVQVGAAMVTRSRDSRLSLGRLGALVEQVRPTYLNDACALCSTVGVQQCFCVFDPWNS